MKRFITLCLVVLLSLCAVSCSSTTTEYKQITTRPTFEVVFAYNNEKCLGNRIYFDTNFPIGTLFDIELKKGADFSIVQSDVAVQVTDASSLNYLQTDAFVIEDETIPDGNYILTVTLVDMQNQPDNVQQKLGSDGKNMIGQDVYAVTTIAGGTTAYKQETFSKHYRVTKLGDKYTYSEQ